MKKDIIKLFKQMYFEQVYLLLTTKVLNFAHNLSKVKFEKCNDFDPFPMVCNRFFLSTPQSFPRQQSHVFPAHNFLLSHCSGHTYLKYKIVNKYQFEQYLRHNSVIEVLRLAV